MENHQNTARGFDTIPRDYERSNISFVQLIEWIWQSRYLIALTIFFFTFITILIAMMLPNLYRAEATLAPIGSDSSSLSKMISGQLGGLASLAGVNLPVGSSKDTSALATLKSRSFLVKFVRNRKLDIPIMSTQWDWISRETYMDDQIYNQKTDSWIKDGKRTSGPTDWEIHLQIKNIFKINQDKLTGIVTVAVEWYDPVQASQWVNWLIQDINNLLRLKEREQAERSIEYLEEQLSNTQVVNMKQSFFQLIESQLKIVMLADARKEYAFSVIDHAIEPEMKIKPRRRMMLILGASLGLIIGVAAAFVKQYIISFKKNMNIRTLAHI